MGHGPARHPKRPREAHRGSPEQEGAESEDLQVRSVLISHLKGDVLKAEAAGRSVLKAAGGSVLLAACGGELVAELREDCLVGLLVGDEDLVPVRQGLRGAFELCRGHLGAAAAAYQDPAQG